MPRDRRPFLILPLAALIAIAPLLLRGCSCGHDFDFHLINWFEASRQLAHGTYPHWAFTPAWNAGEPRFVFYPPLSWLLGSLLGLLMPWTWTPIAYTWIVLSAAGLSLYTVARRYVPPNAALVAAAIYLTNPYTLYTAYERTAYAELLAAAWLPFALHAVLKDRITLPSIAVPVALLWLTNAPAAVMGCYAMALILLIRLVRSEHRAVTTRNALSGVLLGLGLAAFYILPAAWERRFVQIDFAILPGLRPWDNFLFQHTSDPEHDLVLRAASFVAVVLIALTALTLIRAWRTTRTPAPAQPTTSEAAFRAILFSITILTLAIVFLLTPLSTPLWRYLPQLRFLQFPWRFLAILASAFGLTLSFTLTNIRRAALTSLIAAAVFTLPSYLAFQQRCYPEDTVPERLSIFRSVNPGTDPTDEYTPVTADNDSLSQTNPGYWLAASPDAPAPAPATPAPAPRKLDLSPATATTLILNLRNYPAWRITLNSIPVATRVSRKDGLLAIPLPAGPAHIEITYTTLSDQQLGYLISILSLAALLLLIARQRPEAP